MPPRSIDRTDAAAGVVFIALGLVFFLQSLLGLEIGTALRMGPGYAPLVLSAVLIALGALIVVGALGSAGDALGPLAWRGMMFILPAPILFGLTVRGLGFVPAVFLVVFVAAWASPRMRPATAVLLALAVTAFATLVFSYALGLPFRRFGPWLSF